MRKNKFFFKGYYGFQNIGDDLFVKVAEYLSHKYWNVKPVFIGERLPKLREGTMSVCCKNRIICRLFEMYYAIVSDRIIIFGGSTIGRVRKIYKLIYLFPFLQRKTSTMGTSISFPVDSKQQQMLSAFLNRMSFVGVRDQRSFKELKHYRINAEFIFDPAVMTPIIFPDLKNIEKRSGLLGVCPCLNRDEEFEVVFNRYKYVLEECRQKVHISSIKLFLFNNTDFMDKTLIKRIASLLSNYDLDCTVIEYDKDTAQFCREFAECYIILGSRLHSGILAYSLGIPFMLEEYHEKCTDFLNTIGAKERFDSINLDYTVREFTHLWEIGKNEGIISPDKFRHVFLKATIPFAND